MKRGRLVAWLVLVAVILANGRLAQASPAVDLAAPAFVAAAGRGNPWLNLLDGQVVPADSSGSPAEMGQLLADNQTTPLSLAADDFDGDGVADLLVGYGRPDGSGILALQRGNVDAIYPNSPEAKARQAAGTFTAAPFLPAVQLTALEQAPTWLATGDFDADGRPDVLVATANRRWLAVLPGDGVGGFGLGQTVNLPGQLTALAAGDVNRRDGLADLVVAVNGPGGPQLLVYESPEGVVRAVAERFDLPAEATSIVLASLAGDAMPDVAVAAGQQLVVISGRDRQLSWDSGEAVAAAVVASYDLPAAVTSLTAGNFRGDGRTELAMGTADGGVYLWKEVGTHGNSWELGGTQERGSVESWLAGTGLGGATAVGLLAADVSSLDYDDLIMVDAAGQQLLLQLDPTSNLQSPISLATSAAPIAVLPMRLNRDGLSDLVILQEGAAGVLFVPTAPMAIYTVTNTNNSFAGSLRNAIASANSSAGADVIEFNIAGAGPHTIQPTSVLPTITGVVTIDGTSEPSFVSTPVVVISGASAGTGVDGLTITAGSSTVRGLAINQFKLTGIASNGCGVVLETGGSNIIEGNHLGTNYLGTVASPNEVCGIHLEDSSDNTIGGTTAAARNLISANDSYGVYVGGSPLGGGSNDTEIIGNYIGTDVNGTADLGNGTGISIGNFGGNTNIGGTASGERNIISGNGNGIRSQSDGLHLIQGNYIGTDVNGTADLGNSTGINFPTGSDNTVGGTTSSARNVIAGNNTDGIQLIAGTTDNLIQGNYIGINRNGTAVLANGWDGIWISASSDNTVGGITSGARNIISGNDEDGIQLSSSATGNSITGNYIGTNAAGTAALGNGDNGILIDDASGNTIGGGATSSTRNIISGNTGDGVELADSGTNNNLVAGNYIGLSASGTADLGNQGDGVFINGAVTNTIGLSAASSQRNVISGNNDNGIEIGGSSARDNLVSGNYIGTNASGTAAIGNSNDGILIYNAPDNSINTYLFTDENVISGNGDNGIQIAGSGATGNLVVHNFIGLNASGTADLGNSLDGVLINNAANNNIGGTAAGDNVIASNGDNGIRITGSGATNNVLSGNYIGTDAAGTASLGNDGHGVLVHAGAYDNLVGFGLAGYNVISGNDGSGVVIEGAGTDENWVMHNYIGLDANGTADLGNNSNGIQVTNALDTIIGGSSSFERNVISGNGDNGIVVQRTAGSGAMSTRIEGNYIGTDKNGTAGRGNDEDGILILNSAGNRVGFSMGTVNVISANGDNGLEISGSAASDNLVIHNYIGTDLNGTADLGNSHTGIFIDNAPNNTIGGNTTAEGNVVSGNNQNGLTITGSSASGNEVIGNYIGTAANGTAALPNAIEGVLISSAPGNFIGGTASGEGNLISGNGANGVQINGTGSGNVVAGNLIGTDKNGTADLGNVENGVWIDNAAGNTIGGSTTASRNIISGNNDNGVEIFGSSAISNTVSGNYIGTVAAGTTALANSDNGVLLDGSARNTIGGTTAGERNIIAGNTADGIGLTNSASQNQVRGNYIGLNVSGDAVLGNAANGVLISSSMTNTIGGILASNRNVIAGNSLNGVLISGLTAKGNAVLGNYIGTDASGVFDRGNSANGVLLNFGASSNRVGGNTGLTGQAPGNVISGNNGDGISLSGATTLSNTVLGNLIGTDTSGVADVGNSNNGVLISSGSSYNSIGSAVPGERNVISGNNGDGVELNGVATAQNKVQNNYIGTRADGSSPLGNSSNGVLIDNFANTNTIGVIGNRIGHNSGDGIYVVSGLHNRLSANQLFANSGLGIDLATNGVTVNDSGDVDLGANDQQNYPVLASAVSGSITISGSLSSQATTNYTIEFFSSPTCDPAPGHGEGESFIGSYPVMTNGSGTVNFTASFTTTVPAGYFVTATATDPSNNTSEFSHCVTVSGPTAVTFGDWQVGNGRKGWLPVVVVMLLALITMVVCFRRRTSSYSH